jgi:uncharacterized protein (TIGR02594 family)
MQGGPGAVQAFMASQGYPMNGAWCGEFAASVVKSVGGTPPANPAVASNWRNWGEAAGSPQAGDIAVRRGAQTGSTGSHVTFVESYDPKTGMFKGIGGNQGRAESNFQASAYEFRRSLGARLNGIGTQPSTAAAAQSAATQGDVWNDNRRSAATTSTSSHEVNIHGPVNVNTQATDANGIAKDFISSINRAHKYGALNFGAN